MNVYFFHHLFMGARIHTPPFCNLFYYFAIKKRFKKEVDVPARLVVMIYFLRYILFHIGRVSESYLIFKYFDNVTYI